MLFLLLNVSYFYISIFLVGGGGVVVVVIIIIIIIIAAAVFEIPIQECRTWQHLSC
jgi:hypothetical protein